MKLKLKMLLICGSLSLVPLLFMWTYSFIALKSQVTEGFRSQIEFLNSTKISQIQNLFDSMEDQLTYLAESEETVSIYGEFLKAFYQIIPENVEKKRQELLSFFKNQFLPVYAKNSASEQPRFTPEEMLAGLTDVMVELQHSYLFKNPHPIGEKIRFFSAEGHQEYFKIHKKNHAFFKSFVEKFGYYDLFLINTNGEIIYTAFKESDFASNLSSKIHKNDTLAKLYEKIKKENKPEFVYLTEVAHYFPSYEAASSFMGLGLYEGKKMVGVLAVQVPMKKIESVLTNNLHWQQSGLGLTLETLLVDASSKLILSNSRAFYENPQDFIKKMHENDKQKIPYMKAQSTVSLSLDYKGPFVDQVVQSGKSESSGEDYAGNQSLQVGLKYSFYGKDYVLISKVDHSEIHSHFVLLVTLSLILLVISLAVVLVVAMTVSKKIADPIIQVTQGMGSLKQGNFSFQMHVDSQDEIGEMSHGLMEVFLNLKNIFLSDQVNWEEVKTQKAREIEAQNQVKEALKTAELEKSEALKAKQLADDQGQKAAQLAEKEKQVADELQLKVNQILRIVRAAENGDLTQTVPHYGSDAIGQLADGLRAFLRSLSENFQVIHEASKNLQFQSQNLNHTSLNLSENSDQSLKKSDEMQSKTQHVLDNIKNIRITTEELKSAVSQISLQATETSKGTTNAIKVVTGVKDLGQKLEMNAEDIFKFLTVINTIARQTNLLALNATIEAARAGDAGKGFAVVANEVKELARQSGQAAEEITEKVETIKTNSKEILKFILNMNDIFGSISQSSLVVASATEEQFATTNQFIQLVNRSVEEVNAIHEGSQEVKKATESTSHIVKDNLNMAKALGDTSEDLNALVKKFKINQNISQKNPSESPLQGQTQVA